MFKRDFFNYLILPVAVLPWLYLGTFFDSVAFGLPGQSTDEVKTWIRGHETLRADSAERLMVQINDTAAQRFTFQASVLAPGKVEAAKNRSTIRSERIAMYDAINGMTMERLEESLRVIYGLDIYQDFRQAQVVYEYPNLSAINSSRFSKTPLRESLTGELRVGGRYAYWLEIAKPKNGKAYTGQMTVLLKSDLDKLEGELRNR
jgi:hypothetical protein